MQEKYRRDYPGEFVIIKTVWAGGKKEQQREWIENPISVIQTSGRATCIAQSPAFKETFYRRVAENRGDLLAHKKMQTYGIEDVWKVMKPNFLIAQKSDNLKQMTEVKYAEDVIVYTSAANCLKYPGDFFLFPHSFSATAYAQAAWLACFDEHKEVFLVGYDEVDTTGTRQQKMIDSVGTVFDTYPGVTFVHVTNANTPKEWRKRANLKIMTIENYISHCDV